MVPAELTSKVDRGPPWTFTYMFHTLVLVSTNMYTHTMMSRMLCPSWVVVKGIPSYRNVVLVLSQVGHAMRLWSELCFGPEHWSAAAGWWEGLGNALWSITTPDARKPGYGC